MKYHAIVLLLVSGYVHAEVDAHRLCEAVTQTSKSYTQNFTINQLLQLRSAYSKTENYNQYIAIDQVDSTQYVAALMQKHKLNRKDAEALYFKTVKPNTINSIQVGIDALMAEDQQKYWNEQYKNCVRDVRAHVSEQGN
ncbi:hypothetical protein ACNO5E_13465 [Vibrio parahaemolyticus]